jgi:uncharacterized membrane protein
MGHATTRRREIDAACVRRAVEAAEHRTSAEIVVSIAPFFLGRVWSAARRAFARLGVAGTRARNGVLVFVVPSRRQVVVLADDGASRVSSLRCGTMSRLGSLPPARGAKARRASSMGSSRSRAR